MKKLFFISFLILSAFSCRQNQNISHEKEIAEWREARLERLKSKTGWLNIAGLFWLNEGENRFGSDSSNQIVFPAGAPAFCGNIQLKNGELLFKPAPDEEIMVDGISVDETVLKSDSSMSPSLMESGQFAWYIIKRDGRFAIRLRDYNNPSISRLDHIPSYETASEWKITADYIPFDSIRKIITATVVGGSEINNCPGELVFRKGLKKYRLLPFSEGDKLFIIFADKTNGIETYGNGRFLYSLLPDSLNKVILDFNKSYNPPCAFTPFATCPMPPKDNLLDLRITAGEKDVHAIKY